MNIMKWNNETTSVCNKEKQVKQKQELTKIVDFVVNYLTKEFPVEEIYLIETKEPNIVNLGPTRKTVTSLSARVCVYINYEYKYGFQKWYEVVNRDLCTIGTYLASNIDNIEYFDIVDDAVVISFAREYGIMNLTVEVICDNKYTGCCKQLLVELMSESDNRGIDVKLIYKKQSVVDANSICEVEKIKLYLKDIVNNCISYIKSELSPDEIYLVEYSEAVNIRFRNKVPITNIYVYYKYNNDCSLIDWYLEVESKLVSVRKFIEKYVPDVISVGIYSNGIIVDLENEGFMSFTIEIIDNKKREEILRQVNSFSDEFKAKVIYSKQCFEQEQKENKLKSELRKAVDPIVKFIIDNIPVDEIYLTEFRKPVCVRGYGKIPVININLYREMNLKLNKDFKLEESELNLIVEFIKNNITNTESICVFADNIIVNIINNDNEVMSFTVKPINCFKRNKILRFKTNQFEGIDVQLVYGVVKKKKQRQVIIDRDVSSSFNKQDTIKMITDNINSVLQPKEIYLIERLNDISKELEIEINVYNEYLYDSNSLKRAEVVKRDICIINNVLEFIMLGNKFKYKDVFDSYIVVGVHNYAKIIIKIINDVERKQIQNLMNSIKKDDMVNIIKYK